MNYHQALDNVLNLHDAQDLSPKEFERAVERAHSDMSDAIDTLLTQAEELEERVTELLEQVEEFENKYDDSQDQLDRARDENHYLQNQVGDLEHRIYQLECELEERQ